MRPSGDIARRLLPSRDGLFGYSSARMRNTPAPPEGPDFMGGRAGQCPRTAVTWLPGNQAAQPKTCWCALPVSDKTTLDYVAVVSERLALRDHL
jgi:hypothetical protein